MKLDATFTITGPKGERQIQAGKFFKDLLTTALKRDEVLTTIEYRAHLAKVMAKRALLLAAERAGG